MTYAVGRVSSAQLPPTLCHPMGCSPQDSWSRGFSRQEYCSGLPPPPPGDLPSPGIEPASPPSQRILYHCATWEALCFQNVKQNPLNERKGRREETCPQLFSLLGQSYFLNTTGNKPPLKRSLYLTNTLPVFSMGLALS